MYSQRIIKATILAIGMLLGMITFAGGITSSYHYQQVHSGYNVTQNKPVVTTTRSYQSHPWATTGKISVTVYDGSLRSNIVRIVKYFGWKHVIWTIPYDFDWVGQVTMKGNTVQDIIAQLLQNYPLQAVFYDGNKVVVIKPRVNR